MDGAQAETGRGTGQVILRESERGDAEGGGGRRPISRTAGHYWLAQSGGVRQRVTRPRPVLRLSLEERETISRGLAARKTLTAIAVDLGRAVSTVWREVARNSGPNGYPAAGSDRLATLRTARPQAGDPALRRYVEDKLAVRWSPQQINRRLPIDFPDDPAMRVSHETIYTSLFVAGGSSSAVGADHQPANPASPTPTAAPNEPKVGAGSHPEHGAHRRSTGGGPRPPQLRWSGGTAAAT